MGAHEFVISLKWQNDLSPPICTAIYLAGVMLPLAGSLQWEQTILMDKRLNQDQEKGDKKNVIKNM